METFSALLVICAGNSPVSGEFPAQRPVTRGFDVSFDLRLGTVYNKMKGLVRKFHHAHELKFTHWDDIFECIFKAKIINYFEKNW